MLTFAWSKSKVLNQIDLKIGSCWVVISGDLYFVSAISIEHIKRNLKEISYIDLREISVSIILQCGAAKRGLFSKTFFGLF